MTTPRRTAEEFITFNFNGSAAVSLANTILKAGASGANLANSAGTIASQGHNLSSDNGNGFLTGTGDQLKMGRVGTPAKQWRPNSLLSGGSLAINMGDNALAPPMDQRGYGRNAVSDVGAFEFNGVAPPVQLLGAVSRMVHGAAGNFDVNLPLREPRALNAAAAERVMTTRWSSPFTA